MILGLSGGIGSGKSTVSAQLEALGMTVVDADMLSRELVKAGAPALRALVEAFGPSILRADGELNRPALRARAFGDEASRAQLNQIMQPRIRQALLLALAAAPARPYRVLSAPLLLENNLLPLVDALCIVDVPEALQLERTRARDGGAEATLRSILAAQCRRAERLAQAHYVIDNSGSVAATALQVARLHSHLLALVDEALPSN